LLADTVNVDVLMIGHFAKDRIVVDGDARTTSGGGVYYGSIALRRLGLSVAVVTRLHPNDWDRLDELEQSGVRVFAARASATSGIENIYDSVNMEGRICKPLGFAGRIRVSELPEIQARIYALVPIIAGEIGLDLVKACAARGPVALDAQGFVRVPEGDDLVFRPWPEMREGLAHVRYLKADRAEAELLTGETDLAKAAAALSRLGPREVLVTEAAGLTVYAEGHIHFAPFKPRTLAGRTGRGDTCFAIYLGERLERTPEEACRLAAAVTSIKMEIPGPWQGTIPQTEHHIQGGGAR
jgi:sugar/nucleoside kinase (ribokinase family)